MLILYLLKEIGLLLIIKYGEGCVENEARLTEGLLLPVIDEHGASSLLSALLQLFIKYVMLLWYWKIEYERYLNFSFFTYKVNCASDKQWWL